MIETFRLSFFDKSGEVFIGLDNYIWAVGDSNFQQSIFNNIMWLIIVPSFATAFGLVIAVLADRLWWGNIAKSLVFMPMAISFVGASVIWKFVYDYRGAGEQDQIGILNALGQLVRLCRRRCGSPCRSGTTIFLMVILIWIQTGFATVILERSATWRARRHAGSGPSSTAPTVPSSIFWRHHGATNHGAPSSWCGPRSPSWCSRSSTSFFTMTNGQWDTQVLANLMYQLDVPRSTAISDAESAIAIVIMLAVLPIMIWNIRRANAEEGTR